MPLYKTNAETIRLLRLLACFWKDNYRSVSKPFQKLENRLHPSGSIKKYPGSLYNSKYDSFHFTYSKHNNLNIFVLNFNRIKFNLSAIYDKEGFYRFYQFQAALQLH